MRPTSSSAEGARKVVRIHLHKSQEIFATSTSKMEKGLEKKLTTMFHQGSFAEGKGQGLKKDFGA